MPTVRKTHARNTIHAVRTIRTAHAIHTAHTVHTVLLPFDCPQNKCFDMNSVHVTKYLDFVVQENLRKECVPKFKSIFLCYFSFVISS